MSVNHTNFEGDVSLSNDMVVGGDVNVRGDSVFDHDIKVLGWLDASNIRGACKGMFATEADLRTAFPSPQVGWFAYVGDGLPAPIYRCNDEEWEPTGQIGGGLTFGENDYVSIDPGTLMYLLRIDPDTLTIDDYGRLSVVGINGNGSSSEGNFIYGIAINNKLISDVIRYHDKPKPISTDAKIYSSLMTDELLDNKLAKDKDDSTPHSLGIGKNLTVGGNATVKGNADTGNLSVTHDAAVGGNATVEGSTVMNGAAHARQGMTFGSFSSDIVMGTGARIDSGGRGEMQSLTVREYLEVPELRYNRVEITVGNNWRSFGGGVIRSVVPDVDENGNALATGTLWLRLEAGEIGKIRVHDKCQGIFHSTVAAENETEDADDGRGNFTFAGFFTSYFVLTEVFTEADPDAEGVSNNVARYALRMDGSGSPYNGRHPAASMNFVCYSNAVDRERQSCRYSTLTYERYLADMTGWEILPGNIAAQFGDLSNLHGVFSEYFKTDLSGYSAYLNNIYFTGHIEQVDGLGDTINSYTVSLSEYVNIVEADGDGYVVGGLTDSDGQYRIYSAVTVRNMERILTLAPAGESAGKGTYTMSVQPYGCEVAVSNGTVYVTGIEGLREDGSDADAEFDYDAMREVSSCRVEILVNCEGLTTIVKNVEVRVGHVQTPYVGLDLSNEMASVGWNTKSETWLGVPVVSEAVMYRNSEVLPIEKLSVRNSLGETVASTDADDAVVTVDGLEIALEISEGKGVVSVASLPDDVEKVSEWTVVGYGVYSGVGYTRGKTLTITRTNDSNVYSLLPSVSQILRRVEDGEIGTDVAEVSCSVWCDSSDDGRYEMSGSQMAAAGLTLEYSVGDGARVPYVSPVGVDADTGKVVFWLMCGDAVMDREEIPVMIEGRDGKDGTEHEYIFRRTAVSDAPARPADMSAADDLVPDGWTDDATGVSAEYPYEWMCHRKKSNGEWGAFSTPALWAKWGEDGTEQEFIYKITRTFDAPYTPESEQETDHIPDGWTDNPTGVSEEYPYEWMCRRRKVGGVWSDFMGSADDVSVAALWAKWGEDGEDGVSSFKSTAFMRDRYKPDQSAYPTGGSWDDPLPTNESEDSIRFWSDGIPEGDDIVWMTSRAFYSDGSHDTTSLTEWSDPVQLTDTADIDVAYNNNESYAGLPQYHHQENQGNGWTNTAGSETVWMAVDRKKNGYWQGWEVSRIKGEQGDKGDKGDKGEDGEPGADGADGENGKSGPVMRVRNWADVPSSSTNTEAMYFYSGDVDSGERFLDVVLYTDNKYYECVQTHPKVSGFKPGNTSYWKEFNNFKAVATELLLAAHAYIKNLGATSIQVYKDGDSTKGLVFEVTPDGNLTCNDGTFNNVTVRGLLEAEQMRYSLVDVLASSGKDSTGSWIMSSTAEEMSGYGITDNDNEYYTVNWNESFKEHGTGGSAIYHGNTLREAFILPDLEAGEMRKIVIVNEISGSQQNAPITLYSRWEFNKGGVYEWATLYDTDSYSGSLKGDAIYSALSGSLSEIESPSFIRCVTSDYKSRHYTREEDNEAGLASKYMHGDTNVGWDVVLPSGVTILYGMRRVVNGVDTTTWVFDKSDDVMSVTVRDIVKYNVYNRLRRIYKDFGN